MCGRLWDLLLDVGVVMKFPPTFGELSRTGKLTVNQVRMIRAMYDKGMRGKDHAAKFGISATQFNSIGRRLAWAWLDRGAEPRRTLR